ncbi:MAG: DedA family protein [bacterium]|nr:DedA family protein [bacterium]
MIFGERVRLPVAGWRFGPDLDRNRESGSLLEMAVDWVVGTVQEWGYWGILIMMTVESSFVPFPSEVAMIPAGYLAAQGKMSAGLAVAAGLAGSLLGAFINYGLALWLGRPVIERIGHYFLIKAEQLDAADRYFESHGEITTLVARLIPGVRQLISVPAGLARMQIAKFAFYTAVGAGSWSAILVAIGYLAGANEELWRPLLQNTTLGILALVVLAIGFYVFHQRRKTAP